MQHLRRRVHLAADGSTRSDAEAHRLHSIAVAEVEVLVAVAELVAARDDDAALPVVAVLHDVARDGRLARQQAASRQLGPLPVERLGPVEHGVRRRPAQARHSRLGPIPQRLVLVRETGPAALEWMRFRHLAGEPTRRQLLPDVLEELAQVLLADTAGVARRPQSIA